MARVDAGDAMDLGESVSARLAIGIGCRKGVGAAAIVALVRAARALVAQAGQDAILCTIADKRGEAGMAAAARALDMPLHFLPREALAAAMSGATRSSPRVAALFGVGSVAEAAALAGAGEGATLVVARQSKDGVTCAIASGEGRP